MYDIAPDTVLDKFCRMAEAENPSHALQEYLASAKEIFGCTTQRIGKVKITDYAYLGKKERGVVSAYTIKGKPECFEIFALNGQSLKAMLYPGLPRQKLAIAEPDKFYEFFAPVSYPCSTISDAREIFRKIYKTCGVR